ncbi:MAG: hypothetical protein L0G99_13830, partial [Propionibacteriales bacterium]|nr:hypothetical protein [Propionibacteriales bacterium]
MRVRTSGLRQFWDEFVGPEATVTSNVLAAGLGLAGTVLAPVLARRRGATRAGAVIAGGLA